MGRLVNWLEQYILPLANRLAHVRWLLALRDAFISVMPITVAGSFAVLIKSLVLAAKNDLGWTTFALIMHPLVLISNVVWRGTFSLFALFLALALGYQLAKIFEVNKLGGAVVSLSSFTMSVANFVNLKVKGNQLRVNGAFDISQFSTTGSITAIIFGSLGTIIYIFCLKQRIMIELSANLPYAQQEAFAILVPGIVAIFIVGGINCIFQTLTGKYFGNWLLSVIQLPLINMGQGFGMVLLITLLVQLFGFFGIGGGNVLAPILDSIWLTAQNTNIMAVKASKVPPYLWVRDSFNVFAWTGGTGATLMLIVAILLFSKRSDYRTIAKVALAPGIFNINEPIVLGLPVVLNPIYLIPFVLAPLLNVAFSYWITVLGLVNPVQVTVPSIVPPLLGPFLACNYDWRAIILSLINMLIDLAIWAPFVIGADRLSDTEQAQNYFMSQY